MAVSKGRAEFEALAQKNRDTFLRNRGSKSPYRNIDAPVGTYYARIVKHPLGVANVEKKNDKGEKTGFKEKQMVAKLQVSIICSADPTTPPGELEKYKGSAGFIQWYLSGDEAMQRYYDVLDQIGIDTNGIVMTEGEIEDPENQYTLGQVADYIEEQKPCCLIAIVGGKNPGDKFINYKGHVEQTDIEQLIGRPLDENFTVLDEDGGVVQQDGYEEVGQVPFETETASGSGGDEGGGSGEEIAAASEDDGSNDEWEEVAGHEGIWFNKTRNKFFNSAGEEVENPNPPPKPAPPKAGPPKMAPKPTTPAKPTASPAKPAIGQAKGPPKKPGARK